jgi:hypothetical protein
LREFRSLGIPAVGIEPAKNLAWEATLDGLPTINRFLDPYLADEILGDYGDHRSDLIIANNVIAHVPNVNWFVESLGALLADDGTLTIEFPDVELLDRDASFDTIYHEHYSYFSIHTMTALLARHGLVVNDAEYLSVHGGSIRVWVSHGKPEKPKNWRVNYTGFQERIEQRKHEFIRQLLIGKYNGHRIAAFGAAAKGNTYLNYCGIGRDLIDYCVDSTPEKIGTYLPGSHIPVRPVEHLYQDKPDVVVILPWNWQDEIVPQIRHEVPGATIICREKVLTSR